jgi:type IV pilus assembly protein PilW
MTKNTNRVSSMRLLSRRSQGFTLIELMIAVTLGLIILAALTSFFVRTSANRSEMERNSRQIENGRFAINAMRDDLALAGFYADVTKPSAASGWTTPAACVTVAANMGWTPSLLAPQMPVPVFVYPLGVGRPTACTPYYLAGTDVLVVRRFNTEATPLASAVGNLPYVQISECSTDNTATPFLINTGANASALILRQRTCGANKADLWRYREQVYYVRDYSVTVGDGVPTLVRVELDVDSSGTLVSNPVPLVEGIENLRVDFGVDTNNDGLPDAWLRCEAASPCTSTEYSNVMAAKVHIISRNLEPTLTYTDDKTYDLGASGTTTATGDHYQRHVYSAQVAMPNRSGPREPSLAS